MCVAEFGGLEGRLGALDGTFIDVRVLEQGKGRYWTRKGQVAVNVLRVCNPNMQFMDVLSGWEGVSLNGFLDMANENPTEDKGSSRQRVDPTAKMMRYKSWIFFPAWSEIFGKERASMELTVQPHAPVDEVRLELSQDTQDCYVATAKWDPNTKFVGLEEEPPLSYNLNINPIVNSSSATKHTITSRKKHKTRQTWPKIPQLHLHCEAKM
ncbi:hypothetical protein Sango_0006100 [Sesamum angolense]|uniref:Uncharacterized protein n=1 Tax=Sesamum angolense TaxID=2727404 RepID=A0AAE1XCB9_9LAMI|nr:hypothetical protein Sango_0006100 [Sesamum angolense]